MTMQSVRGRNGHQWGKIVKVVMARDARRCQLRIPGICTIDAQEVDHIRPVTLGGGDNLDNLRAVCKPCHQGRGMREDDTQRPRRYSIGGTVTRDYTRRKKS